jgi:hypothetical protein
MAKYLKRYDNKTLLDAVQASTVGQPWVGSEITTRTVRYEPKGIIETVDGEVDLPETPETPETGEGGKEVQ